MSVNTDLSSNNLLSSTVLRSLLAARQAESSVIIIRSCGSWCGTTASGVTL